jgi:predicted DNA-binding transcriptional regulator YafY
MRRADRLFQLVQLLRARRFATGQQLANELGVSKRTVYRDISDLAGSGVPIRGEAGVGYQLERGFELPPLTFNDEEVQALVLGARMVSVWGDSELAGSARTAMTKVEAVLPDTLRQVLLATPLYAETAGEPPVADEMALLRRAISEKRYVHFAYQRADGEQSSRDARPLGLYFWGRKWTLATWCELRNDYRSFRPDRMQQVQLLDRRFDGEDGVTLAGFLEKVDEVEAQAS